MFVPVGGRSECFDYAVDKLQKGTTILGAAQEKEIYKQLKGIPELAGVLPMLRQLDDGVEIWLFIVVLEPQLTSALEGRIAALIATSLVLNSFRWRVFRLSDLPRTRSGRVMRRATEKFINRTMIPNRLQMRNPEVLEEIAHVAGFVMGGEVIDVPIQSLVLNDGNRPKPTEENK